MVRPMSLRRYRPVRGIVSKSQGDTFAGLADAGTSKGETEGAVCGPFFFADLLMIQTGALELRMRIRVPPRGDAQRLIGFRGETVSHVIQPG